MMNNEITPLDPYDFFSKATQEALSVIEEVLHKQGALPNISGLLYFCCVFIRLILLRFETRKREVISYRLREVLQIAADGGKGMCQVITSAKIDTQEGRDQAMHTMAHRVAGSGMPDARVFLDVAKQTQALAMVNDGLWKLDDHLTDNFTYTPALEKEIEVKLDDLIAEKINVINQTNVKCDDGSELAFFVSAAMSTGVMVGYTSVLYHQSLDDMIDLAIKQIIGIPHPECLYGADELVTSTISH